MTPNAAGMAAGTAGRPPRALSATPALMLLLLGGLALRLTLAYVLFPGSGFESDLGTYVSWALTLAQHGPGGYYATAGFADYPPAYLLVLWPIGLISNAIGGGDAAGVATTLIKVPPMLLDLAAGWLLYRLVLGWSWPGRRAESLALGAAALFVFNPVTWYDSALWGQTDAAGAFVLLLCVAALIRGNPEGAAGLAVLAALVKPQFGVVAIPLVGIVLLRRHLFRIGSGPRHAPWGPAFLRGWLARHQGPLRLVTALAVAVIVFYVLALPFGLGPIEYLKLMSGTAANYDHLSVNAYNPWALLASDGHMSLAQAWDWSPDTTPLLGPIPGVVIGGGLLIVGFLWALARAGIAGDRWTILLAAAFLCMAFFILPTRVHERYLYPAFVFLPLLAAADRRWLVSLVVLAAGSFINLHGILTMPAYATPNLEGLAFDGVFAPGSFTFVTLAVVLQTAVFAFGAWELRRRRSPDPFELVAGELAGAVGRVTVPDGARAVSGAPGMATAGAGEAMGEAGWETTTVSAAVALPPAPPSAWARFVARLTAPRLRRDRSASLSMERGGRITRVDLGAMLLIVIVGVLLRGFNLARPYDMYFDEVYHARTATEFLQHWRYGEVHAIYEYTHPHLAKYAMAASIDRFGNNQVTSTGELGAGGVRSAVLEPRWSPFSQPGLRNGDRLFVATDTGVAVIDLRDLRGREATLPIEASALAIDSGDQAHTLYVAQPDGSVVTVDVGVLDAQRTDASIADPTATSFATLPDPAAGVRTMTVTDSSLVVLLDDETLVSLDLETGEVLGTTALPGAVALAALPSTERVVAHPAEIPDASAAALLLADALFLDADEVGAQLATGAPDVVLGGYLDASARSAVQEGIDDGTLTGVEIVAGPVVAVAATDGAVLLDASTLAQLDLAEVGGAATGLGLDRDGFDDPVLYVSGPDTVRGFKLTDSGPQPRGTIPVPAAVSTVLWNAPSNLMHVLGRTVDGQPTVYVIETNGDALFADARLPFDPVAIVMDTQPERPSDDRMQLIALAADGRTATVDVGSNTFAWRLPGVLLGALTAAFLYLLARILFRRRAVAVFAGVLALAEGMLFANARIAMNDVYVTFFVIAALTVFLGLWLGRWKRAWQVVLGLIVVGILLGLALASKWVAAYAIGGIVLLILLRSALGRLIALVAMIGLTAVLGGVGIQAANVEHPNRNWLFLVIMVALTLALAAAMVRRPVRWTVEELRFSVALPAAVGLLLILGGILGGNLLPAEGLITGSRVVMAGGAAVLLGMGIYLVSWLLARAGIGPLSRRMTADPDAPVPAPPADGWLLPGARWGIPWLFALACLSVIPLGVYVLSYLPWADLGNQLVPGFPAGNTGQTLWDLTKSMYDYHNNLRAKHAATSPWWAWLLDLKPVWFYQDNFANDTAGSIHDGGNLVIFWMGAAAMLFCSWAAWVRRSLPLTAIVLMFAAMWLPWARIDRATFQYHVYASLPFVVMALAYLLAELWHGPSRFGWGLARVAAALAILGAPLLWLLRRPLCSIAGVEQVNPGGQACGDSISRQLPLSEQGLAFVLIVVVALAIVGFLWRTGALSRSAGPGGGSPFRQPWVVLVTIVALAAAGVIISMRLLNGEATSELTVGSEHLALGAGLLLAIPAWMALRARDPRRFAGGVVFAAIVFFIAWYPNVSGLPLPNDFVNVYQGLLPTWNWAFQFSVNLDPPIKGSMIDSSTIVIAAITVLLLFATMIAAYNWRGRRSVAAPVLPPAPPAPPEVSEGA